MRWKALETFVPLPQAKQMITYNAVPLLRTGV